MLTITILWMRTTTTNAYTRAVTNDCEGHECVTNVIWIPHQWLQQSIGRSLGQPIMGHISLYHSWTVAVSVDQSDCNTWLKDAQSAFNLSSRSSVVKAPNFFHITPDSVYSVVQRRRKQKTYRFMTTCRHEC